MMEFNPFGVMPSYRNQSIDLHINNDAAEWFLREQDINNKYHFNAPIHLRFAENGKSLELK